MTLTTLLLALSPALAATDPSPTPPVQTPPVQVTEAAPGTADAYKATPEGPRWGIGARGGLWRGEHGAPSLGGHIRIQPWDRVGIELFEQSAARPDLRAESLWHAHVIGFHLLIPVLPAPGATALGATVGACVAAEALTPLEGEGPSVVDLRFAPHAGLFIERGLHRHLSAGLRATGFVYAGNAPALDGWSATTSNRLSIDPVGEVQATVTLWR